MEFNTILEKLIQRKDLSESEMTSVMTSFMQGNLTEAQMGAFLTALRMKGESIEEISAAARVMRNHSTKIAVGELPVVDTCGTGGDGTHTFNISTAAAFIAAGAGVKIAKHGNRSVSSKCGSADVLKELGVNIDILPPQVSDCIQSVGIGFLFAPKLHPAMKYAVGPRRELGVRTIFNMLGPLTNPAQARRQVLGVFSRNLTQVFVEVLRALGSERVFVVHGLDGLDEITITQNSQISELKDGEINTFEFNPLEYSDKLYNLEEIRGGDSAKNAQLIKDVLGGTRSACSEIAILNGGAAIYVADLAENFKDAIQMARESVQSGNALKS